MSNNGRMTIIDFLEARISDDERHARKLADTDRRPVLSIASTVNHPQRVLAECAAKRAMIAHFKRLTEDKEAYWAYRDYAGHGLEIMASVYSDHGDFNKEWA